MPLFVVEELALAPLRIFCFGAMVVDRLWMMFRRRCRPVPGLSFAHGRQRNSVAFKISISR